MDEDKGIPVQDIWLDVQDSLNQNIKITGYPTEKNPLLLERIIKASSNEGDIVLDCFSGSGTTLDLAEQFNRNWIGIDNSSESIKNIFSRFYNGLEEMGNYVDKNKSEVKSLWSESEIIEHITKHSPDLHQRKNFNFYTDRRFKNIIFEAIAKHFSE